jgi:hypothetical protein
MNAGLQKLLSLGTSLSIGLGLGWFARLQGDAGIPRSVTVVNPPAAPVLLPELVPAPRFSSGESPERGAPRETFEFLLDEEFDGPAAAASPQRDRHRFNRNPIRVE